LHFPLFVCKGGTRETVSCVQVYDILVPESHYGTVNDHLGSLSLADLAGERRDHTLVR